MMIMLLVKLYFIGKVKIHHDQKSERGCPIIKHQENEKSILLFIREKANDANGNTMGYVFIGEGNFKESEGSKPMNIQWELNEPMPNYLWNESAKMSVG